MIKFYKQAESILKTLYLLINLLRKMEEHPDTQVFVEVPNDNDLKEFNDEEFVTTNTKRLKCPECNRYSAENEEQLTRHIRKVHWGENPFQCSMCEYSTSNKVLFEEHVRIHQGIKPYKCSYCPHTNVSKKNLKKHELIHRPDNPLKCPNCSYIAKHRRGLACHKKKCSASDKIKCKKCSKVFLDEDSLLSHSKVLKKCDQCSFKVCTKSLLSEHKVLEHGKQDRRYKKSKLDIFKCIICKWSSNSKPRILLHLIHHPNQEVDDDVIDISVLRNHGIMS